MFGLLLFSCKSDTKNTNTKKSAAADFDKMAQELCKCMRPLAEMNTKVKQLVEEGKTQEVAALFPEIERLSSEGEACAADLETIYGVIEGENEKKAKVALKKACPDIASMLDQAEQMEQ